MNESIESILAEMRYGTIRKHRTDHELLALYSDRIEAAWKRETSQSWHHREMEELILRHEKEVAELKKQTGNAAAMREALQKCVVELEPYCDGGCRRDDVLEEAKAALSAPPRQCDVGTAEEQVRRHCSMCVTITKNGTKGCDYSKCNSCFAKWSQMPYEAEEGGAK